jgi:HSP20 family molecular chaperone IbpA
MIPASQLYPRRSMLAPSLFQDVFRHQVPSLFDFNEMESFAPIDVKETPDNFFVKANVPGMQSNQLK